jgi:hypothetical protein
MLRQETTKGGAMKDRELRGVGLNYRGALHLLDHIAPFCVLMDIPLICPDDLSYRFASRYYPGLRIIRRAREEISAEWLADNFDYIAQSDLWAARGIRRIEIPWNNYADLMWCDLMRARHALLADVEKICESRGRPMRFVHVPHGCGDKVIYIKFYAYEDITLVYGEQTLDIFKNGGTFQDLRQYVVSGNFRLSHYERNKEVLDRLVDEEDLGKLPKGRRTFLYAPTWNDKSKTSTFYDICVPMIDQLPADANLIVKLHPNLELQSADEVARVREQAKGRDEIVFLSTHSLVYPFQARGDVYIGDGSSVGYDFLSFDRPMFFLNRHGWETADPRRLLHSCGYTLSAEETKNIFRTIEAELPRDGDVYAGARAKMNAYAFTPRSDEEVKRDVLAAVATRPAD